ncbi:MAG: hypothetical protein JWL95_3234 [Gemmatimonadetes bacterium]|nr:hypothetical protein [Gemmatimonadota bacterium]
MLEFLDGPSIFKVPGSDGLVLAPALVLGEPSVSAPMPFIFPFATFVAGVLVLLRPDGVTPTIAAQHGFANLRIIDQNGQPLVSDTRGTLRGTAEAAAPLLALQGRGFHPFAMQKPLKGGEKWIFSLQNESDLLAQTVAGIFLYLESAEVTS